MSKLGKWVFFPLKNGQFGLGRIARESRKKYKGCLFGYFFIVDTLDPALRTKLKPHDAVLKCRFSDKSIIDNKWSILDVPNDDFELGQWAFPEFVRRDLVSGSLLKITYDEFCPMVSVKEEPMVEEDATGLPRDGFFGSEAVERVLESFQSTANGGMIL